MRFLSKYSSYLNLVTEQQPGEQQDAAAPDPAVAQPQPNAEPQTQQVNVPPEGYVNLVKMVAKALVMNIPPGEIDALLSGGDITKENAFEIQNALKAVLNDNEVREDNVERLNNPNYKKFVDSINENNFMQKYDKILGIMKKRSPYIK